MGESLEICVPDIGDFDEVEVVELLVAKGDTVEVEDPLVSVESEKATMEIPSTVAGLVVEVRVSEGDRVSEGSVLVVLEVTDATSPGSPMPVASDEAADEAAAAEPPLSTSEPAVDGPPISPSNDSLEVETSAPIARAPARPSRQISAAARLPVPDRSGLPHASPLVRRYARELGVPIGSAEGSGPHGRVLVDDLKEQVRARFAADSVDSSGAAAGPAIPPIPIVDHAAFGTVREEPLSRIQKVSGPALQRSWLNVPHVTQHEHADVTELERFRRDRRDLASARGVKLSPLLFVMKAAVVVLREFPTFRSSLAPEADRLIVKEYFHLGIAVDTDQGLVVPVIRDVDRKGIFELAEEVNETAERARARKLSPDDLKGACFTISSLGGIGGTAFSPIVNAPEVAILGLSQTRVQPVWQGPSPLDLPLDPSRPGPADEDPSSSEGHAAGRFEPRLVLPFSLSYDHRVIDGASAARFTTRLARVLSDPMQLLL